MEQWTRRARCTSFCLKASRAPRPPHVLKTTMLKRMKEGKKSREALSAVSSEQSGVVRDLPQRVRGASPTYLTRHIYRTTNPRNMLRSKSEQLVPSCMGLLYRRMPRRVQLKQHNNAQPRPPTCNPSSKGRGGESPSLCMASALIVSAQREGFRGRSSTLVPSIYMPMKAQGSIPQHPAISGMTETQKKGQCPVRISSMAHAFAFLGTHCMHGRLLRHQ